jgi:2,5-dihydroxypyridine 5,6-dioxygenase
MPEYYEYELSHAAKVICEDLFKLTPGETIVITVDTEGDSRVAHATAGAACACGAKPLVVTNASPLGVGKEADPMLPIPALTALLSTADAWLELNREWLFYSSVWETAFKQNDKLRHLVFVGVDVDMLVRCVGRVPADALAAFETTIAEMTMNTKHMRMATPAGGDLEFDNFDDFGEAHCELGVADSPGSHMLGGQIVWPVNLETVNGTLVFDGSCNPPIPGVLTHPIALTIRNGAIEEIKGGSQAQQLDAWTKSFDHPQMRHLAHTCYGFNPGARLSGNVVEDERIWGATEWGIGLTHPLLYPGGIDAPSHCDGICLNTSVWLDGVQITDQGKLLDDKLQNLAKELGR